MCFLSSNLNLNKIQSFTLTIANCPKCVKLLLGIWNFCFTCNCEILCVLGVLCSCLQHAFLQHQCERRNVWTLGTHSSLSQPGCHETWKSTGNERVICVGFDMADSSFLLSGLTSTHAYLTLSISWKCSFFTPGLCWDSQKSVKTGFLRHWMIGRLF